MVSKLRDAHLLRYRLQASGIKASETNLCGIHITTALCFRIQALFFEVELTFKTRYYTLFAMQQKN
jgi:hypothetical protein